MATFAVQTPPASDTEIADYIAGVRTEIERSGGGAASAAGVIIGAASACWDNLRGAGTFESTRACALVDLLLEYMPAAADPSTHVAPAAADWFAHYIEPGTIDPEDDEEIPPGWYITGTAEGEPEDVLVEFAVNFAVDTDGSVIGHAERVARSLAAVLQQQEANRG